MKAKTFAVLASQKALLVSENAEKNPKNNSENHSDVEYSPKFVLFSSKLSSKKRYRVWQ